MPLESIVMPQGLASVVPRMLAVGALNAGVVAVIVVSFTTEMLVAGAPPIVTPVAPVKFVPVSVTDWPPAAGPLGGLIALTEGAAM